MKDIIKATVKYLKSGRHLVMATVIKHKGSTPREAGARLIILEDGTTQGTIGGGLVEAKSIEAGKTLFESKSSLLQKFDMTQQTFKSNSMICGGNMTIVLEYIQADDKNVLFYEAVKKVYQQREEATFIFKLDENSDGTCVLCKGLAAGSVVTHGDLACSETLLHQIHSTIPESRKPGLIAIEEDKYWAEPLLFPKNLVLFGAGHVSRTTATLGVTTGFDVTVVDDRPELVSRDFFPEPIELKSVENLDSCCSELQIDENSFLVVLTRSHIFDKSVLKQTLKQPFGYLGMIGSRRKRNTIYESLQEEGFTKEELEKVHSPIGLNIGANTPAEIAVSIIAELIEMRAKLKKGLSLAVNQPA
ncbi:MAG: XdhC family protein [Proteobacteria bacterium]|nr:XdhC family protein [Pseudomonadota bacterium]